MNERTVYAILLPLDGQPDGVFCVCRAESPENAAAVVRVLLEAGDKKVQIVTVKKEVCFD